MTGSPGRPSGRRAPLVIHQPEKGYRYSIDSVLLAAFAAPLCGETALDLGTGSGVILLFLAAMCPGLRRGVGVEIQPRLLDLARRNFEENGLAVRLSGVPGDFRRDLSALGADRFDLVVSNPPYRALGEGRRSPDPEKDIARHEVAGTMAELFRAAARRLSPRGRFATLCLPDRLPELFDCASAAGIHARTLRFVHPFAGDAANLLLFAGGSRRPPRLTIAPPLVVYSGIGRYSPEVEETYRVIAA